MKELSSHLLMFFSGMTLFNVLYAIPSALCLILYIILTNKTNAN